jgi:uncharacterized membrane protein YeaQ/YmgE (transglycosylase-associated protein family)
VGARPDAPRLCGLAGRIPPQVGLGIGGAVVGGWLFTLLTTRDAVGLDVFGLVVTLAGAGAMLIVYHMFFPHVRKA